MANTDLSGVQTRTDNAADEPLPAYLSAAADKLAARFPHLQAASRFQTAATHAVQLAALAETGAMSDLDADDLAHAEDLMAGLLPLIGGA
ncbi:hypothetical protein ABT215_11100 [Streptomyces sp900105755]|uniref:hypothetical protein n=1 Tax=Streptomyces sp. 900105755 TaxID=3154389 RepID=UPI0033345795